jgi:hypothetical protein
MFALVVANDSADASWAPEHSTEVVRRWPFVNGVEAAVYPLSQAISSRRLGAMVKVHGACVHGQDVSPQIPGFKPGIELLLHAWDLPRDVAVAKHVLAAADNQSLVDETCVWIMKRILRSGFELVMSRAACYTRDLVAGHELFAGYYPAKAGILADALTLALAGGGERERCLRVIESVDGWLYEQICLQYGAARIEQLLPIRPTTD